MQGAPTVDGRPGASMAPYDFEKSRERLTKMFPNYSVRDVDVLSHAMYPKACALLTYYYDIMEQSGDDCSHVMAVVAYASHTGPGSDPCSSFMHGPT
jgi:pyruvate carboxylase